MVLTLAAGEPFANATDAGCISTTCVNLQTAPDARSGTPPLLGLKSALRFVIVLTHTVSTQGGVQSSNQDGNVGAGSVSRATSAGAAVLAGAAGFLALA